MRRQESGFRIQDSGCCCTFGAALQSPARGADKKPLSVSHPKSAIRDPRSCQRGFSIITAIFLLVVLTALGAMSVTFFTAQQQSSAINVLGSRAYQAARAGIEWGTFQITQSQVVGTSFATACQGGTSVVPVTPSTQLSLTGTPLSSFGLADSCYATQYAEGAISSVWVYTLTATASGVNGATAGSTDYVQRVIQATIASAVGAGDTAAGVIYQRESY